MDWKNQKLQYSVGGLLFIILGIGKAMLFFNKETKVLWDAFVWEFYVLLGLYFLVTASYLFLKSNVDVHASVYSRRTVIIVLIAIIALAFVSAKMYVG